METKIIELRLKIDTLNQLVDELWQQPKPSGKITINELHEKGVSEWLNTEVGKDLPPTISEMEEMFRNSNGELFIPLDTEVGFIQNTSELQLCSNSLRLAKARLGKILGLLGEATPYQNDGKRETVADIEPASDKATLSSHRYAETIPYIAKIDWLREEVGKTRKECDDVIDEINQKHSTQGDRETFNLFIHCSNCLSELDNARFYLGFELGHIRDGK
jgi:hypothetical protein